MKAAQITLIILLVNLNLSVVHAPLPLFQNAPAAAAAAFSPSFQELFDPLHLMYSSLLSTGDESVANHKLLDLLRQVRGRGGG